MPSLISNLLRLSSLTKAEIKSIRIDTTTSVKVPSGKIWLLLSGIVYHVTGTQSELAVKLQYSDALKYLMHKLIPAATASHVANIFSPYEVAATDTQIHPAFSLIFMGPESSIAFDGGAASYAIVQVLEW